MSLNSDELLDYQETLRLRKNHLSKCLETHYSDNPLKIVKGEGCYLYDPEGKRYLDCTNNVAHVGHSHPDITKAINAQLEQINTNSRFLHDNIVVLAKKLGGLLPGNLSVCYFVNSGSEANDLALQLARCFTGNRDAIILDWAYHGAMTTCMEMSPYKNAKPHSRVRRPSWVHVAQCPDTFRGPHRVPDLPESECTRRYVEDVARLCSKIGPKGPAMFICESMQACGGQVIYPAGYLQAVYETVRRAGGVCVADEVQTGFGRVGSHMWAFQTYGPEVVPDIVVLGKPMGNGLPISCVVTTPEIDAAFSRGGIYFNTYGGNPVCCAAALTVLSIMEREQLQQHAETVGRHLLTRVGELAHFPLVGDARGCGLFVGIDLVRDRGSREPATDQAQAVVKKLRERGIILFADGPFSNVLKIKPPMCFDIRDVDELIDALKDILPTV